MKKRIAKNKAFTLIEILVVATLIGVLVTVTAVSFANSQKRSRDARRKADLATVLQALVLYRQDNGSYGDASAFSSLVNTLYSNGYLTNNQIIDPKSPTYNYSSYCSSGSNPNCNKVRLRAWIETDGAYYDVYTP